MHMAVMDLARSRGDRIGQTQSKRDASQQAKARMRAVREIGATFSVLVLIMIGALAVRLLLSLPHGAIN
jgi:hypothetical protein